jgi:uncharacterized damage-inducible protein DinB
MPSPIQRPFSDEYHPLFAIDVDHVGEGDILEILSRQIERTRAYFLDLSEEQALFRLAPHEWSIKEIISHLIDVERIFSYRAICFARGETQALPGFEQEDYVRTANSDIRDLQDLVDELVHVRRANLLAFKHLTEETSQQLGTVMSTKVSVRALLYIIAGHELYHIEDIRDKYLPAFAAQNNA